MNDRLKLVFLISLAWGVNLAAIMAEPGDLSQSGRLPRVDCLWLVPPAGDPVTGDPAVVARGYLAQQGSRLGLDQSTVGSLNLDQVSFSLAGSHARFQLQHTGITVVNAHLDVHLDWTNRVTLITAQLPVADSFWPDEFPNYSNALSLAMEDFDQRARSQTSKSTDLEESTPELKSASQVYYLLDNQPVAAWEIRLNRRRPFAEYVYWVGGDTKGILAVASPVWNIDGTGCVFRPNPVNTLNNTSLRDDSPSAMFAAAYETVNLLELIGLINGKYVLTGPWVDIVSFNSEPPYVNPPAETTPSFIYDRSQPGFVAVMAYYWVDSSRRYIQGLGFNDIAAYPIQVDVHGRNYADNSYYISYANGTGQGYLVFGDGGVPDAEDADVILHEYNHAIMDSANPAVFSLVPSDPSEKGSIAEGCSDYWAYSSTYDLSVAHHFDPDCIMEWDATAYSTDIPPCLRRTDEDKIYPRDIVGKSHQDCEIWSQALRDLLLQIGKPVTDKIVLESYFLMPSNVNFFLGAKAMLAAEHQLYHGGYASNIYQAFANRQILILGDLDNDRKVSAIDLVVLKQYLAGVFSPGQGLFQGPLESADLDKSGQVDAADFQLLSLLITQ